MTGNGRRKRNAKPADDKPADDKPAETTPAETATTETTPAETAPAETTPAETAPAETADPIAAAYAERMALGNKYRTEAIVAARAAYDSAISTLNVEYNNMVAAARAAARAEYEKMAEKIPTDILPVISRSCLVTSLMGRLVVATATVATTDATAPTTQPTAGKRAPTGGIKAKWCGAGPAPYGANIDIPPFGAARWGRANGISTVGDSAPRVLARKLKSLGYEIL